MPKQSVDDLIDRLRDAGFKATTPRRRIVESLVAHSTHITADDLIELVQRDSPEINRATVYRTLETLEALGLLYRMHTDHGPAEWHLSGHAHQHLICETCGVVQEVDDPAFARLSHGLLEEYGFQIDMRHLGVTRQCRRCVGQAKATHVPAHARPVASR